MLALLKQTAEKPRKLVLALAALFQKRGNVDFVSLDAITGSAHIAALAFMLDKKPSGIGVEHQVPPVFVGGVGALI